MFVEASVLHSLYSTFGTMRIAGETELLISASPQELPVWAIAVGASVGACVLLALGVAIVVVTAAVWNRRRASTFSPREDSDEEIGKASQALCIDWMCDNRAVWECMVCDQSTWVSAAGVLVLSERLKASMYCVPWWS